MRGRNNDTSVCPVGDDGHFRARGCAESYVDDIGAAGEQRTFHQIGDQFARNAGIATDDDSRFFIMATGCDETHVGCGEFYDIRRRKIFFYRASDRSADARNGFDECHGFCGFSFGKVDVASTKKILIFEVNILLLCQIYKTKK